MAKDKITDYDSVASNNLDVGGISVAEGMLPSGVNNSIRELMSHQKEAFGSGTPLYVDQTNNRVGVNNAAPATALDVTGSVNISNSSGATLKLTSTDTTGADTELLGQIDFVSSDSSGGSAGTQARIKGVYEDNGDSSGIAFLTGNSTGSGSPTINEVMRIRHEGRVGIGTSSPAYKLSILENANNFLQFSQTGDSVVGSIIGRSSSKNLRIQQSENANMEFWTNNTERMRITNDSKLLLNTASTSYGGQLTARQTAGIGVAAIAAINSATSGTRRLIDFFTGTSTSRKGSIESDGTNTSYNTSSDYRLKENVTADWDATTRLKQLNPVRFNFIENADKTVDGFLAHEVQDIVPEAITGTKDAMMDEEYEVSAATGDIYTPAVEATFDEDGVELTAAVDEVIHSADVEQPEELAEGQQWRETTAAVMGTRSVPDFQGIDQSKLVPLLVKTIQELEARITALEA